VRPKSKNQSTKMQMEINLCPWTYVHVKIWDKEQARPTPHFAGFKTSLDQNHGVKTTSMVLHKI